MLKPGDVLNQSYQILEEIGEGGNGVIFLAVHLRLQKKVVVKKIKDESARRHNVRKEADILKNLHHRYLPQVYDFFDKGEDIYTIIDFIPGRDMKYYIDSRVQFDEKQIILWLRQLSEALDYLHSQNPPIIHSDIKPSNIMIKPDGTICLIDFNVSMSEGSGNVSGFSQRYASPEQLYRKQVMDENGDYQSICIDERSDLYSLGLSIYSLMLGNRPPADKQAVRPLASMKLNYDPWLTKIIDNMIQFEQKKRFPSAAAVLDSLAKIKKKDGAYRRLVWWQRGIWAAGLALMAAGAVMISIGIKEINLEAFEEAYEALTKEYDVSDFENVTARGVDILNNDKYKLALREEPVKKADILYIIGNAYFGQEDYANAVSFYENAISFNPNNPECYRDYAIALIRRGDKVEAEKVLDRAIKKGLGEDSVYLVRAEIYAANAETREAADAFKKVIDLTKNEEIKTRACLLLADTYRQQKEYEKECDVLENCWEQQEDTLLDYRIPRALAAAYTRYSGELTDYEAKEYLKKAAAVYEKITGQGNAAFTDYMNLVILYQASADYTQCRVLLEKMQKLFPDDYRVYMRMALMLCEAENQKSQGARDYSAVKTYYDQAKAYYQSAEVSGDSDENMQILEETIAQLYEKGWLKE